MDTINGIYDDLNYLFRLISGVALFVLPFAPRKSHFPWRVVALLFALIGFTLGWYFLKSWIYSLGNRALSWSLTACYNVLIFVLVCLAFPLAFSLRKCELLYFSVAGFTTENIVYVLYFSLTEYLRSYPTLYIAIDLPVWLATTALVYGIVYHFCAKKLQGGSSIIPDSKRTTFFYALLLVALWAYNGVTQYAFYDASTLLKILLRLAGCLFYVIFLALQFGIFHTYELDTDVYALKQMLSEREKQYQLTKENIDLINLKCHDLKHQIDGLKSVNAADKEAAFAETEKAVDVYDSYWQSGNETLDVLLSEKSLQCHTYQIAFAGIADGKCLEAIAPVDLFCLLGNAFDNAIESVKSLPMEERSIDFSILPKGRFVVVQITNYCQGDVRFVDGLPQTTKSDETSHGFGTKSIRYLARKYGGEALFEKKGNVFTLILSLPL
jgi:hypothetical protein